MRKHLMGLEKVYFQEQMQNCASFLADTSSVALQNLRLKWRYVLRVRTGLGRH